MDNEQLKNDLSKLDNQALKDQWHQLDFYLWDLQQVANRNGYSEPAASYMGSDLAEEQWIINQILKERGLPEEYRREGDFEQ